MQEVSHNADPCGSGSETLYANSVLYTYYIRYCTLLKAVISSKFSLRS